MNELFIIYAELAIDGVFVEILWLSWFLIELGFVPRIHRDYVKRDFCAFETTQQSFVEASSMFLH